VKQVILFSVFLLIGSLLSAQDLYHKYNLELVQKFSNNRVPTGLVSQDIQGYGGLSTPTFVRNAKDLKIYDVMQNRMVVLDAKFQISQAFPYPESGQIFASGAWYMNFDRDYGFEICTHQGISINKILPIPPRFRQPKGLLLHKNFLFVHDDVGLLNAYQFQPGYTGTPVLLNTEQTRRLFKPDSGVDLAGLSIDSQDRLFLNGELVTLEYKTFASYFKEKNGNIPRIGQAVSLSADPLKFSNEGTNYLGRDADGNRYWGGEGGSAVFNAHGNFIEYFIIMGAAKYRTVWPHVAPNGDLYFLGNDDTWISLYRVKNIWERPKPIGILNDSAVRLRATPNTTGQIITQLNKADQVVILDQTQETEIIGGKKAVWYKVKLSDNREGWVFGAFVDIQE
jgi:Bacterial SH3 domain